MMEPPPASCRSCGTPLPPGSVECPLCEGRTVATPPEATPGIPGLRVLRLLGTGGMGKVYLAEDPALGRQVAVKLIAEACSTDPEARARFLREARAMAGIDHPNVLPVHSFGETAGALYLVMPYVQGETLADRLRRLGPLPLTEALGILAQCVAALAAADAVGTVHRDVKPSNILIDEHGRVRVADFGLARLVRRHGDADLSQTGQILGTPHYLAPEQARSAAQADFRSDIYSLGITFFEMLTGAPPFSGATPFAVLEQHAHTPLPSLRRSRPDLPEEAESLVQWMTQKEPAQRPSSYPELQAAVTRLGSLPTSSPPQTAGIEAAPEPVTRGTPATEERSVLVARERELTRLASLLDQARGGRGSVVFLVGEAGSGKTALAEGFARRAAEAHADLVVASGNCDAQTGVGDPYHPFREILGLLTGDTEARVAAGSLGRLASARLQSVASDAIQALLDLGPDIIGTLVPPHPLLASARACAPGGTSWLVRLEALIARRAAVPPAGELQQSDLCQQVTRVLARLALRHSLLVVLDDLHWADAATLALLFHLGRRLGSSRALLLGTFRSTEVALGREGDRHPLEPVVNELKRVHGDIEVDLGQSGGRAFVDALLDTEANQLSEGFRDALTRQTGGHPLFTVELLRSMQDRGMLARDSEGRWAEGSELRWEGLPARVDGVIAERLGRLPGPLRRLLDVASIEGETFTAEVVAKVAGVEPRDAIRQMSAELERRHRLVVAEGIRRIGEKRVSSYRFRHALFQKVLYGAQDEAERAYLHEDVGKTLEAVWGEHAGELALSLARHFREAGDYLKAASYLHRAGERATAAAAYQDATAHLTAGLALLVPLPEGPERALVETELNLALADVIATTKAWSAPEIGPVIQRALALSQDLGHPQYVVRSLVALVGYHFTRGEYGRAAALAGRLGAIANQSGTQILLAFSPSLEAVTQVGRGQFVVARENFEKAMAVLPAWRQVFSGIGTGHRASILHLVYLAKALWCLGFPEQAQRHLDEGLALARQLEHPFSVAFALGVTGWINMLRGDVAEMRRTNAELRRLSEEKGFTFWCVDADLFDGWLAAAADGNPEGVDRMHQAWAAQEALGCVHQISIVSAGIAEADLRLGRAREVLAEVDHGLEAMFRTDERIAEAELHRLKGEAWLRLGDPATAQASFEESLEVARRQQARSWELRAATSLARLWQCRGDSVRGRELLEPVYRWFTEGLATADLREAERLLDSLAENRR